MKHLLFSTSLMAFSQVADTTVALREYNWSSPKPTDTAWWVNNPPFGGCLKLCATNKPDTLRAIILATMCRKCAAEPMPGYVVIEQGKRPVYLDCRKRALKWPQVGWDFREVDPNRE